MFPAMISAVRALTPQAFIIENVEGLLRKQFSDYFRYILLCLEFPERVAREGETWFDHLSRLAREEEDQPIGVRIDLYRHFDVG